MNFNWLFLERRDAGFNWFMLVLLSFLAPALAARIHSYSVFHLNFRWYNAELWVLFGTDRYPDWRTGVVVEILVKTFFTSLFLWLAIKSPIKCWVVWLCCVVVWTYVAFLE